MIPPILIPYPVLDIMQSYKTVCLFKQGSYFPPSSDVLSVVLNFCTDFDWDASKFHHSSLYGATFLFHDENSVDNTGMGSFIAEQLLHSNKTFSASHPTPPTSRLRSLEGWPQLTQRIFQCLIVSCSAIKLCVWGGGWPGLPLLRQRLVINQLVISNWGFLHPLFFGGFVCFFFSLYCFFPSGYFLFIKLSLTQHASFHTYTFPILSPIPLIGGASEHLCVA